MNLNQKFLFQTDQFMDYKDEKFPLLDEENPENALDEISMSCAKRKIKSNDVYLLNQLLFTS